MPKPEDGSSFIDRVGPDDDLRISSSKLPKEGEWFGAVLAKAIPEGTLPTLLDKKVDETVKIETPKRRPPFVENIERIMAGQPQREWLGASLARAFPSDELPDFSHVNTDNPITPSDQPKQPIQK